MMPPEGPSAIKPNLGVREFSLKNYNYKTSSCLPQKHLWSPLNESVSSLVHLKGTNHLRRISCLKLSLSLLTSDHRIAANHAPIHEPHICFLELKVFFTALCAFRKKHPGRFIIIEFLIVSEENRNFCALAGGDFYLFAVVVFFFQVFVLVLAYLDVV